MIDLAIHPTSTGPILMLVNASTTGQQQMPENRSRQRLADYAAIKLLGADIIDRDTISTRQWTRLFSRIFGIALTLAILGWLRRNRYRVFYCDAENSGLALAFLFKLTRTRRWLFIIGHRVTPPKKAVLIKNLRLHTHFTILFLHSSEQYKKVIELFKVPPSKVKMLPYQVDTDFWSTENANFTPAETPYICTAGLEFRDYKTLLEAIKEVPVGLKIGAASHWSKRKTDISSEKLPPNVEVRSYNYGELRDLYAGSAFVVVPLVDVDFQAGITVILEAMAMGKAVVVTRSQGQGDTIIDRRRNSRDKAALPTWGNLDQFFDQDLLGLIEGQTGFYVAPGDAAELRRAIIYLLAHPDLTAEMGARGRKQVENLMRVEHFAQRIGQTIQETSLI